MAAFVPAQLAQVLGRFLLIFVVSLSVWLTLFDHIIVLSSHHSRLCVTAVLGLSNGLGSGWVSDFCSSLPSKGASTRLSTQPVCTIF